MNAAEVLIHSTNAEVAACNARILGMEAENKIREIEGKALAYDEKAFLVEADSLAFYAGVMRDHVGKVED